MSSSLSNWSYVPLQEVVGKITSGGTPKAGTPSYYGGDIPFLKIKDLTNSTRFVDSASLSITERGLQNSSARVFPSGTVLTTMYGTIGVTRILRKPMATNQAIAAFLELRGITSEFLMQLINFEAEKLASMASQTTQANISATILKEYLVDIPPLTEQKKIASILTSVDEVIENTQKKIDKLQDLKKATMNELLTKGIGHTEFKDSELGRIPKSWEVKKLGVFAKVKGGKRLPKGEQFSKTMTEYPYIRVSDFENQGINKTRLKYVSGRVRDSIKRYVISSKDLYISIAGSIGIIGTIPDELSGSLLTENAAKIVLESNVITRDFLKCNLSSEIAQSQFRQEKGTGGGVPKLALFRIEETVVALPKIDEQLQISSTIASLDKAISDVDSKLSQTQSLKKSLMQDLLTGKVRVTVN